MKAHLAQDIETLHELLAACVHAWQMGYDTGGYQCFAQSVTQLESMVETHFDDLQAEGESLIQMLARLARFVQQKDIMAVQDVVEYEWLPLVIAWKRRWAADDHTTDTT
ncbi:hypothetical protein [Alicyclobacillus fodiniaquatilis]|uniref:Uncharacterized protein n=1 Tax=Alicyclobacillus fodiniaquatilis TaxID=1661150 RepID=A0ABW4JBQ1_9BACL